MKGRKHITRFTIVMVMAVLAVGVFAGAAFAGALGVPDWTVSNTATSATSVTYTYMFTTTTGGIIATVTMTVPDGTAGTPAVGTVYGIDGTGSVALATNVLTYTIAVEDRVSVDAGTPVYIQITGLTNRSSAGSDTAIITTQSAGPVATIDTATTAAVAFGGNTTGVTVAVAQTLLFTNSTAAFNLHVDPTNTLNQTKVVSLSVKTNAESGYTLSVKDAGLKDADLTQIAAVNDTTGVAPGSFPDVGFGFLVTDTSGTGHVELGTPANYYGYKTAAEGAAIFHNTGPTGDDGDLLTITNKVAVDFSQAAGNYSDTITYIVAPDYN